VSGNTGESPPKIVSLKPEKPTLEDDLESARILFSEGLLEEAKRTLHRMLLVQPNYKRGRDLLDQILKHELEHLYDAAPRAQAKVVVESPDEVIRRLEGDLGLLEGDSVLEAGNENWKHGTDLDARSSLDLGIAFFEMGCYRDAARELQGTLRLVRQSSSELGELGLSAVALYAESLLLLEEAFDAKMLLEPPLSDTGLRHEDKTALYYLMGRVEERLGHRDQAKGWYGKVVQSDPGFRDAEFRMRIL
jgi:tetratricopeptide (TPR) repeat protein